MLNLSIAMIMLIIYVLYTHCERTPRWPGIRSLDALAVRIRAGGAEPRQAKLIRPESRVPKLPPPAWGYLGDPSSKNPIAPSAIVSARNSV